MRHVVLIAVVAVVALAACGGSTGATPRTTSRGTAGPPAPSTTLAPWIPPALGEAGATAFLEVVRNDLSTRGLDPTFDTEAGTVSLSDGRVLDLSTIAALVAGTDPTTWPSAVSRALDELLAP